MTKVLDSIENGVNRLSDTDWLWYPFVSWRPAKNVVMGWRFIARYYLLCLTACFGADFLLYVLLPAGFALPAVLQNPSASFSSYLLSWFGWFFSHGGIRMICGIALYCMVMFLIFVYFWNRRAQRLARVQVMELQSH